MLHNEARKLLLKALETTHNAKEVAECFSVHISTVYRLKKQMEETGSIETRTNLRGRKPVLSAEDLNRIDALIQNQSDITLQEIIDSAPLNKPKNTTILSSVRLNGETAYTTYQGGTTSERFTEYLKTVLIPTLELDSVVVMDNMSSHHTEVVKSLIEQEQVHYAYLPPYSPDLNPIEKMWSKLKAFLRKKKVRLAQNLPDAVRQAFDTITPQDCAGWFRSCGYSG